MVIQGFTAQVKTTNHSTVDDWIYTIKEGEYSCKHTFPYLTDHLIVIARSEMALDKSIVAGLEIFDYLLYFFWIKTKPCKWEVRNDNWKLINGKWDTFQLKFWKWSCFSKSFKSDKAIGSLDRSIKYKKKIRETIVRRTHSRDE